MTQHHVSTKPRESLSFRIDPAQLGYLETVAHKIGISSGALVRYFVRLRHARGCRDGLRQGCN